MNEVKDMMDKEVISAGKGILAHHYKMQQMLGQILGITWNSFGSKIKDISLYKEDLWNDNCKKHKVKYIYNLPDGIFNEIESKIWNKFLPLWEEIELKTTSSMPYPYQMVQIQAYMRYHFAGWVLRFAKERREGKR